MITRAAVLDAVRDLDRWGRARGWSGTDPYDALNARRLTAPLRRTPTGRRILTQVVKRSPIDLRPLLAISPGRSAAALAWLASAYARDTDSIFDDPAQGLRDAIETLLDLRCPAFAEPCWGYHFDVQTRVFFYPRSTPNTIATAFAGHAFLDAYDRMGEARWLDVAQATGDFFLAHVPATETPDGIFFGYLVGDRTPIHNASLLICSLLARLARRTERSVFAERAAAGVAYALAHQNPDGSWAYGEQEHLRWVDNFHTGYVLDALMICRDAGIADDRLNPALERGLTYYRRELFREDGAPKYYPSSLYPIDSQCVAQGIQTFALASRIESSYADWAWQVAAFAIDNMRRPDGAFIFQRRRLWTNPTPHIRWCEAPMLLALANLLMSPKRNGEDARSGSVA